MNYVTQARLFTGVKMPMEALARAQEGLVLWKNGSFLFSEIVTKRMLQLWKIGFLFIERSVTRNN